jgi:hypothetical protein
MATKIKLYPDSEIEDLSSSLSNGTYDIKETFKGAKIVLNP